MKSFPKIMYYHDGRHSHMYRYEPPMSKPEMNAMIDEVASTSVDAVMFCLGEGRTMLHDTKAGELLGHNQEVWDHEIFRRAHQNAVALIRNGQDPLQLVCDRSHEKNMLFYPSLIVNAGSVNFALPRISDFRKNNRHLEIGASGNVDKNFKGFEFLDFEHKEARDERFALIEETINKYPIDGFELQFSIHPYFFQPDKAYENRHILTKWISDIHETIKSGNSAKELLVRIPNNIDECLTLGFDVEEWVKKGIVDGVIGEKKGAESYRAGPMEDIRSLVKVTSDSPCRVYSSLAIQVGSDRINNATTPMLRAMACNSWDQGIDGLYLVGWYADWPYAPEFYDKLRELPHPDIMDYKDKYYFLPKRQSKYPGSTEQSLPLPRKLEIAKPINFAMSIADNLEKWHAEQRIHDVLLRIRIASTTELDVIEFKLNDKLLPSSISRKINHMYLMSGPRYRDSGYWFIFHLTHEFWPVKGSNTITVTLIEKDSEISKQIHPTIKDIELETKYLMGKNFHREFSDPELGAWVPGSTD